MNLLIFFVIVTYLFTRGNAFVYNNLNYKRTNRELIIHKHISLQHYYSDYQLKKKKGIKKIYSFKRHVSDIWNNIKTTRIGDFMEDIFQQEQIKKTLQNNFLCFSYLFNKCKLDRLIIAINVGLYLYLNRIDKDEEKKIYFHKGNLLEVKEEQKAEKYKCNYYDIYKTKNFKTFFTSLFIHKNILHLYFNMSSLISIYKLISNVYTNSQILVVFLLSGTLSNIISYICYLREKKEKIFFKNLILKNYSNENNILLNKNNKIICGSSSCIYSLYGMHMIYIIFFYFKNNYIINTNFLYNFFYSFISSLFLENVSHFNHVLGFLCGFFFSFLIILFDKN
ncbi:rhomboid protease ROM7 [Plasmodium gonderi]|uniref:Rhomboid protease ROM7 n=1 Tax=Plasmodium gonderi TaxID=77519 RepID=A0A1Y1JMQ7_PLAGO|nr:rhomboid protease ROM7 [Plasmodium gonderi]GAW81673.1 rhomboid protease ROM7 [Plasmodium gonderi]